MIGLLIDVSGSGLDVSSRVARVLEPARINPVIGRAATNVVREHLFAKNRTSPNQLGGRRTNYYLQAGRNTSFKIAGDHVIVSVNQVGMRLRFYGGTVRPKTAKFLAIPVAPEAHGKRPREFGDLEIVFGRGGKPIGLARKGTRGRLATILYRLADSVTQAPDSGVLPTPVDLAAGVITAVNQVVDRAKGKAS